VDLYTCTPVLKLVAPDETGNNVMLFDFLLERGLQVIETHHHLCTKIIMARLYQGLVDFRPMTSLVLRRLSRVSRLEIRKN